jgi:hypothetical protein
MACSSPFLLSDFRLFHSRRETIGISALEAAKKTHQDL